MGPNPQVDLTTLGAVKSRAEVNSSKDDDDIQDAITGFSQYILGRTGNAGLVAPVSMNETRDGNGNNRIFVRTPPIINVSAVIVNGISMPQAGPWPASGYFVADDKKSIKIRSYNPVGFSLFPNYRGGTGMFLRGFPHGNGNIQLQYFGGYAQVPFDLELAVRHIVAINYKRKTWQDLDSRGLNEGGSSSTTRFRSWDWPPEDENVIRYYDRKAIIT